VSEIISGNSTAVTIHGKLKDERTDRGSDPFNRRSSTHRRSLHMNTIKTTFYRLGGADYEVIKDCSKKTKVRYLNLALALFLTVALAGIGGFDIASQFNPSVPVKIGVSIGWALVTLSFDYFLINGGSARGAFKYIRIVVGLANICITITALFVLLNQATIDSKIRLSNSSNIKALDETYLAAKETRYSAVKSKKSEGEKYNSEVVIPEAKNGYPGPRYAEKKAVYDGMIKAVEKETSKLDSLEVQYLAAYQNERSALESIQSNDFFAKAKLLPDVMRNGGGPMMFLAGCLFIFLSYIELQAISLKLSMSEDDEYHTAEKTHEARNKEVRVAIARHHAELEQRKLSLNTSEQDNQLVSREYRFLMNHLDDRVVREAEMRGKVAILRAKGFTANAAALESELLRFTGAANMKHPTCGTVDKQSTLPEEARLQLEEIFKCTQPMAAMLETIRNDSPPGTLAESIFKWVVANIVYDKGHGKFFYRTARETYNDGHGICGELSVLYMAFLRASGINAAFVEVKKDHKGDDVSHACVQVKQDNSQFLSDPAYKSFVIEHVNWSAWSDEKLSAEYRSWNN
jgi:hypothetical protein